MRLGSEAPWDGGTNQGETAFRDGWAEAVAEIKYDGRHRIGDELARWVCELAVHSVGRHDGPSYRLQTHYACEDISTLRERIKRLDGDIQRSLDQHRVGQLLTIIDGIGPNTAARMNAEVDLLAFRDASALAACVGVAPSVNHSGKRARPARSHLQHRPRQAASEALDAHASGGAQERLAEALL